MDKVLTNDEKMLCIYGTGGFGRETLLVHIDLLRNDKRDYRETAVFMVDDDAHDEKEVMGIKVISRSEFDASLYRVVIGVGDPATRKKLVEKLPATTEYASLVHPNAVVSDFVSLGEGAIVTAGVIITCNITIGKHAHLNLHTTVGHDCVIGDFFTTAPGAKISGLCDFGDQVYVGTNAGVRQGIKITSDVTIGMGAQVVKHIEEPGVYVGSPAKKLVR